MKEEKKVTKATYTDLVNRSQRYWIVIQEIDVCFTFRVEFQEHITKTLN